MTPEGKVKAKVKKLLGSYTHLYLFMPVPQGYQASTLDFIVCYAGRFIAIETKKPGGKFTKRQELVRHQIEEAGGRVFSVSYDEELDDLKVYLDHLH